MLGVPRSKLVIGMATYGRGFALDDRDNFYVGAPITGMSPAGSFTREAGFMAYYEVNILTIVFNKGCLYRNGKL